VSHPLRQGLALARDQLKKDGHLELQAYVDAVLAPRGWMALRDSEQSVTTVPLSLTITSGLKAELKAAAAEFDVVLDSLAEEGFNQALEKGWLPPRTVDKRSLPSYQDNPAYAKAILQLQVDADLRDRVREALPEMTERAGYRVTMSGIAVAWIADQLGVRRPGENLQPLLLQVIPRAWRDHWEAVATERDVTLQSVLEDGIRALRDGSWQMPRPVRAAKGSGMATENVVRKVMVRIDADLLDYLDEAAPRLAEQHGRKVFPGTIALAILKDRLGLPAGE
jgi:hypothetical protein